ncbi:11123_t:CDS:1, partial [Ambispora gerdemannii]
NRPTINKVNQDLKAIVWSPPESPVFTPETLSKVTLALSSEVWSSIEQLSGSSNSSCEDYCEDSENLASYHEILSISKNTPEIIVD